MFTGRSLPQVAQRCSFTEVYLGGEAVPWVSVGIDHCHDQSVW